MASKNVPITVAHGDGIGPEIMEATLHILKLLSNRGVNVYPNGFDGTFCTDHWRARYMGEGNEATQSQIVGLLDRLGKNGLDVIKTENLYTFDGVKGYVSAGE
jgi:hypothetical protein